MKETSHDDNPRGFRRAESFFGRRKGPKLTGRKVRLFDELLPKLAIDTDNPCPINLSELFDHNPENICLEIGFGGGEHLAGQAQATPETGYLGVEPFINGLAKMLGEVEDRNLANVRTFGEDATLLLDWLPEKSLERIDLLYPDPWPKKRHWKRRFVNTKNLQRITRVLKPTGQFRFASDIESYVNWTLMFANSNPHLEWSANRGADWNQPWSDWISTRYEAKALREGRTPAYLVFTRL